MGKNIEVVTTGFDNLLKAYAQDAEGKIEAAVVMTGKAKAYWFIPEVGSRRGARPWPNPRKKTRLGRSGRVFSMQAPDGYIHILAPKFFQALTAAYKSIVGNGLPTRAQLVRAANQAANTAKGLIRNSAPVDSGALRSGIQVDPAE